MPLHLQLLQRTVLAGRHGINDISGIIFVDMRPETIKGTLDSKKNVIAKEDFTTAFSVANMHKDVHICLDLAKNCDLAMPGEENAARVYDEAMAKGYGSEDFSATVKVVKGR